MSKFVTLIIVLFALATCSPVPVEPVSQPVDQHYILRGRELVNGVAACGSCHAKNLSGKNIIDPEGNQIFAPNLTNAAGQEIGASYLFALIKASGIDDDDSFSSWAHKGYEWMSDEDTLSIVSYLKLLDPIRVDSSTAISNDRNNTDFITESIAKVGYVPQLNKNSQLAYGKYLVDHVARCQVCHNGEAGTFSDEEYLVGGKKVYAGSEEVTVPALKISGWSENQIMNYLRSGSRTQPSEISQSKSLVSKACPVPFYSKASDQDLLAITYYLKSLAG